MSKTKANAGLRLPEHLQQRLGDFRQKVWRIKTAEYVAFAVLVLLAAWLTVFLMDRIFDSPSSLRGVAFFAVLGGLILIPVGLYRWVWRQRTLAQTARLIFRKLPGPGDRLLSVIDLVDDESEQRKSPILCKAAVDQVAADSNAWDLTQGMPFSRLRTWGISAGVLAASLLLLGLLAPQAIQNAWSRLLAPWGNTPRYTFASLNAPGGQHIVAHGEPCEFAVTLSEESRWCPSSATLAVGEQAPLTATLAENGYRFEIPPQVDPATMVLSVGDSKHSVSLKPTLRPELQSLTGTIKLPDYLERTESVEEDLRSGAAAIVRGATVQLDAIANRELESATVNGKNRTPEKGGFDTDEFSVDDSKTVRLDWMDKLGLAGKEPFHVEITCEDDAAPSISASGIKRQQVVLVSEQLTFQLQSQDDFGVQKIGMKWQGYRFDGKPSDTKGSMILSAGGPDRQTLNSTGTFKADSLGIEPQAIEVQFWSVDYLPDREPTLSPPCVLYVLSPDEHAIWLTNQLSQWHRRALEVRDRELKLHAANREIREMTSEELNNPESRRRIERQAAAEKSNGRRLRSLTEMGEGIIQQATKNPEFGVGHLEKWAEMLQVLQDISANRMPSVADLLKDAADAPQVAKKDKSPSAPMAGRDLGPPGKPGSDSEEEQSGKKQPPVPAIVDRESSMQPPGDDESMGDAEKKSGKGRLTLPVTTLAGKAKAGESCPAGDSMDEAVEEQEDLLAEFEKVANELNNILANLEGSTLIKRLKAESRRQVAIAGSLGDLVESSFGQDVKKDKFEQPMEEESTSEKNISWIMDDMQAYFDRRPFAQFKEVLSDMKKVDVLGSIRRLQSDIPAETGISLAQCDYWADTLDRWAEDLVDPAGGGT